MSARPDLASSPGARIAGEAALEHAQLRSEEVDLFDLYSCFPVAVSLYADALRVPKDRDLTVTGGMPFAGGPYNNYVLQSTARIASLLRRRPRGATGVVSAVSGIVTKQGFGVWSTADRVPFARLDVSSSVPAEQVRVVDDHTGTGRIVAATVLRARDTAPRAAVLVEVGAHTRTVAASDDRWLADLVETTDVVGWRADVADGLLQAVG